MLESFAAFAQQAAKNYIKTTQGLLIPAYAKDFSSIPDPNWAFQDVVLYADPKPSLMAQFIRDKTIEIYDPEGYEAVNEALQGQGIVGWDDFTNGMDAIVLKGFDSAGTPYALRLGMPTDVVAYNPNH